MINELKKMIVEKLSEDEKSLINENENLKLNIKTLEHKYSILMSENAILKDDCDKLKNSLNTALDEIAQNQIRIRAILNQLKDKNGGE